MCVQELSELRMLLNQTEMNGEGKVKLLLESPIFVSVSH